MIYQARCAHWCNGGLLLYGKLTTFWIKGPLQRKELIPYTKSDQAPVAKKVRGHTEKPTTSVLLKEHVGKLPST